MKRSHELVRALEALAQATTSSERETAPVALVRIAGGLAAAAARVLPPGHRGRYREEYRSELYELAAADTPRWRQIVYALRLLDRAWVLRAELRAPATGQARS